MDFDRRYLLARYPTGGVVVDLESGNYFRVNASAAAVCDALRAGSGTAERIATELGVSLAETAAIIADVISGLATPAVRGEPQGSYHFYPVQGGYVLRHRERTVLEINDTEASISLPTDAEPPEETQLELYVRALAPKLLFQRDVTVLHASACLVARRLIAFAGVSGAGKTTTAHAFAAAGARLVSEDLVVLAEPAQQADVLTDAEPFVQSWARETAGELLAGPGRRVSSRSIVGLLDGRKARLDQILFLDKTRRANTDFVIAPLEEPEALLSLMTHDFLGAIDHQAWRRFFEGAVALLKVVDTKEAAAPDGLDHLVAAAARYVSRTAS